jgi:NAD(P)-dependent dehydrogenase (short-subunit alcohol dehydrogenase family)
MELSNRVAVVTGASGGIGEAIAKELSAAGVNIAAIRVHPSNSRG